MLAPRIRAFLLSLGLHAACLALLVEASHRGWTSASPPHVGARRPAPAERQRLIWYVRTAELPPVAPLDRPAEGRRPKLLAPAPQVIRARARRPESRRQMILQSPPQIRLQADVATPNVIAMAPPAPPPTLRRFQLQTPPVIHPAIVAEAPQVAARPTEQPRALQPQAQLPPGPRFQALVREVRRPAPRAIGAAEAPRVAMSPAGPALGLQPIPVERPKFVVPDRAPRGPVGSRALPASEAPRVALGPSNGPGATALLPAPEVSRPRFELPSRPRPTSGGGPRAISEAPAAIDIGAQPSTVVVGLDPVPSSVPLPPGNRSAEFAAGPASGNGSGDRADPVTTAQLRVPNLSIAPAAAPAITRPPLPAPDRAAFRRQLLSTAIAATAAAVAGRGPDPILRGSSVYTMAVDMPNISSYEGSWTVRFTELGGSSPEDILTAPVATRKVDPVYSPSAAAEGVEGKVLLYAVIRRDGRVDQVRLVQGIDERLDVSAVTAFSKWEFHPATRNGTPVDLEAVVQIPFRLKSAAR